MPCSTCARKLGCSLNTAGLAQKHLSLLKGSKIIPGPSPLSENIYSLQKGSRERGVGVVFEDKYYKLLNFYYEFICVKNCMHIYAYIYYVCCHIHKKTCKDKETHWTIMSRKLYYLISIFNITTFLRKIKTNPTKPFQSSLHTKSLIL